ncbi:hypothetical protein [Candidatus Methylomirabilis limnetica]|jgi:hypothetical protein|uniref:hypothetical protein n=1 Tax=Candidatus Methylomirabilis limnetica TaxID=2033718 RepID=UPI00137B3C42|nr:hypothetical protein [Candidatus Methylomirabilis limnetica]
MSQKYDKLKTLLQELLQLDQTDLDFGLYRQNQKLRAARDLLLPRLMSGEVAL